MVDLYGRLDKPFHRPECQCESCLAWCKANPLPQVPDRPQPKFFHHAIVKVRLPVIGGEPVVATGRVVGHEWRAASRLGDDKEWFYFVAFTPTGQAVVVSESELVMGMR